MISFLHLAALVSYAAAGILLAVALARGVREVPVPAIGFTALGVALHALGLAAYTLRWRELPLAGLAPVLSSLGLLIAVGSLVAMRVARAGPLGLVLVPLGALLSGAALAVGVRPSAEPALFRGLWFALHVVFAVVGYAGLAVAFASGLMYLLQFRQLKSKRFGAVFRFFPPLDTLDRLGGRALLIGFPALSLALALGWAWTARFQRSLELGNPQVIWGVVSWVVFAAALLARAAGTRRGYRGALTSVVGFLLVVAVYLLLRLQQSGGGAFL